MSIGEAVYEIAAHVAAPALRLAAPFSDKLRRGVRGRRESMTALLAWAAAARDVTRPLVWLHAPSVGEAFMAQAVLAELQQTEPRLQSMFTHFSPSAERVAAQVGADWAGYLPWDTRANARTVLNAVRPDCVAFVRTEIWPVLAREAQRGGARVVLVNAVLAGDSSRLRPAARLLLGPAYARLDGVGVVSDVDAAAFPRLGVRPDRIRVTGDARFDQVCRRVAALDADSPLLRPLRGAAIPWLVAGSTWAEDEAVLVPQLQHLRGQWRAIIAPHEPTAAHVAALERNLDAAGLSHVRLPAGGGASAPLDADVVVVDRVGVLADLYAVASAAWVGGGFGRAGLHSVVEPAALGVPVLYGPRHGNAHEAARLADAGGGIIVHNGADLGDVLSRLARDAGERERRAAAARAFVAAHTGGAARGAALILDQLRR